MSLLLKFRNTNLTISVIRGKSPELCHKFGSMALEQANFIQYWILLKNCLV